MILNKHITLVVFLSLFFSIQINAQINASEFLISRELCDTNTYVELKQGVGKTKTIGIFKNFEDSAYYIKRTGRNSYEYFVILYENEETHVDHYEVNLFRNRKSTAFLTYWMLNIDTLRDIPDLKVHYFVKLKNVSILRRINSIYNPSDSLSSSPICRISIPWDSDYLIFQEENLNNITIDNEPCIIQKIVSDPSDEVSYLVYKVDKSACMFFTEKKMKRIMKRKVPLKLFTDSNEDEMQEFIQ